MRTAVSRAGSRGADRLSLQKRGRWGSEVCNASRRRLQDPCQLLFNLPRTLLLRSNCVLHFCDAHSCTCGVALDELIDPLTSTDRTWEKGHGKGPAVRAYLSALSPRRTHGNAQCNRCED